MMKIKTIITSASRQHGWICDRDFRVLPIDLTDRFLLCYYLHSNDNSGSEVVMLLRDRKSGEIVKGDVMVEGTMSQWGSQRDDIDSSNDVSNIVIVKGQPYRGTELVKKYKILGFTAPFDVYWLDTWFPNPITKWRIIRNISQSELSRRSGVPQPAISRMERDQEPNSADIVDLAMAFNIPLEEFFQSMAEYYAYHRVRNFLANYYEIVTAHGTVDIKVKHVRDRVRTVKSEPYAELWVDENEVDKILATQKVESKAKKKRRRKAKK